MGNITLTLKELRSLLSEAIVNKEKVDKRTIQIYDALSNWCMGTSMGKITKDITPDIIDGIKELITKGELSEPDRNVTLHRGFVISEKQLMRWLQWKDEKLPRKGQVAAKIVIGKEGPASWSPLGSTSASFAGASREAVAHFLDDPFAVIVSAKVSDNHGAFVDISRVSVYEEEAESMSIAPVTTSIVSWVKSGTSQRRHEVMDEIERMVQYIGI